MSDFDPYAVLGLERTATPAEIRAAYRRLSKEKHPDAGGSAEAFAEIGLAHNILMDESRRATFDREGKVTEDKPDNARAGAIQLIDAFIGGVVAAYATNFDPYLDPRRRDLVAEFRQQMNEQISAQTAEIFQTEKAIKFVIDFKGRFSGKDPANPIERSLERQIAKARSVLDSMKEQIEHRRRALEIIDGYTFRADSADASHEFFLLTGLRR